VPFFRLLLFLILGITAGSFLDIDIRMTIVIFVLGLLSLVVGQTFKSDHLLYQLRWMSGIGMFLCLFAVGSFRFQEQTKRMQFNHLDKSAIFLVEIIDAPVEKPKSIQCRVQLEQCIDSLGRTFSKGKAILYLQKDSAAFNLKWGDKLFIHTSFSPPQNSGNPYEFDYQAYLARQGVGATAYVPADSWQKVGSNEDFSAIRFAHRSRDALLNIFKENNIRDDEYAVLAALTLGYTGDISQDVRDDFAASGAMHILSVSGQHVAILYLAFAFLLSLLDKITRSEKPKIFVIILFLWAYAVITGLSSPTIRSAIMFSFVLAGQMFDRKISVYNSIFASAFLMLAYNPFDLFNVSFQLTYTALLGIVFFQPLIYKKLSFKNRGLDWIWNMFSVSVAAQIGILPLQLYYFQQFSNYFLLTNMLVIPIATFILYFTMALLSFSFIPFLAKILAFVVKWLVWTLNFCVNFIHELPASLTQNLHIGIEQVGLLTVAIFASGYFIYRKTFPFLATAIVALSMIFAIHLFARYQNQTSSRLIVYAINGGSATHIINGRESFVISNNFEMAERVVKSVRAKYHLPAANYYHLEEEGEDKLFDMNGKRILILNNNFLKNKEIDNILSVDYLILHNNVQTHLEELSQMINAGCIIIDRSHPEWKAKYLVEDCERLGLNYHLVAKDGAFNVKLE
jgi:competence protein ComEC